MSAANLNSDKKQGYVALYLTSFDRDGLCNMYCFACLIHVSLQQFPGFKC